MAGLIDLVLERDGHDQPWGFRLQGGVDLAMPLSVQRVLVGTPADGTLHKGDVITRISCTETKNITHQQAADLFNNAGNQIAVQIKRAGVQASPAAPTSAAPLVNGTPSSVPIPGGIGSNPSARPENPAVRSLPKTHFVLKSDLPRPQIQSTASMETLSIQSQPYRTLPLVQPSAKVRTDLGVGSISHLKMQDEHISGVKEPQYVPQSQAVAAKVKHDELIMKQKVRRPSGAALGSVDDQGGGEEEGEATPWGCVAPQARRFTRGEREGSCPRAVSSVLEHSEQKAQGSKDNSSSDFMKIDKTTFKVGGEIVQLKKPPNNCTDVEDGSNEYFHLRKSSVGNIVVQPEEEREQIATRAAEGRSRSLGYSVHTTRLEELSQQYLLTADNIQSLNYGVDSERQDQEAEYTIKLEVPRVEPQGNTVEVDETIRLAAPAPVRREPRTVHVEQTVRIKRNYYMW